MTNRMLVISAAVIIVAGIAFIANNYFYIYKHPTTPSQSTANTAPASAQETPAMPKDAQQAAVYQELEDRLKAIRTTQK